MIQALRCGLAVDFGIQAIIVQVNLRYSGSSGGEGLPLLTNPLRGFVRPLLRECPQRPK
jgi:hypothetical protein